mmetsp:Transcript_86816/g.242983  ORF Transcript_86816/g.242983 Transcript_86816/m.242983 type:complete len:202 (-) Transcript_86816:389-994(-)
MLDGDATTPWPTRTARCPSSRRSRCTACRAAGSSGRKGRRPAGKSEPPSKRSSKGSPAMWGSAQEAPPVRAAAARTSCPRGLRNKSTGRRGGSFPEPVPSPPQTCLLASPSCMRTRPSYIESCCTAAGQRPFGGLVWAGRSCLPPMRRATSATNTSCTPPGARSRRTGSAGSGRGRSTSWRSPSAARPAWGAPTPIATSRR